MNREQKSTRTLVVTLVGVLIALVIASALLSGCEPARMYTKPCHYPHDCPSWARVQA